MNERRVVQARVAAYTGAGRVELEPELLRVLEHAAGVKNVARHGAATVEFRRLLGALTYAQNGKFNITNARYRVMIQPKATGGRALPGGEREAGWTVEVVWYAQGAADLAPSTVYETTRELAGDFGKVYEARTRRLDLAADVVGYDLRPEDAERFKRPSWSAKVSDFPFAARAGDGANDEAEALEKDAPDTVERGVVRHWLRKVTGFTVCPGGLLMARIYDKTTHLKLLKEETRKAEEERWREGGWQGPDEAVTRVEFQIRGEALKEFGVRDPDRMWDLETRQRFASLDDVVDRIWRACLSWVELRDDRHERIARCDVDPRWRVLSTARFQRDASAPQSRRRLRGGVSVEQAMGAVLSVLGARELLTEIPEDVPPGDTAAHAERLQEILAAMFALAGRTVAEHFAAKWTPYGAIKHVAIINRAARARCYDPLAKAAAERAAAAAA